MKLDGFVTEWTDSERTARHGIVCRSNAHSTHDKAFV